MSDTDTTLWFETDLTCKPLNNLKDIQLFLFDPPAWRTLCQPLTRHSKSVIKNSELSADFESITLEKPQSFCHFNPDEPSVARHDEEKLPKLLVCHDMANGYHDDSMIDGTSNHQAYAFYNWAAVDIFCYFSHHLVTIPPLGWINVAHAHGVKVIGTFITEWSDGIAFWKKIMNSTAEMENMVSALVTIAKTLKFEGWLINIENKMSEPEMLLKFMKLLHKTLHEEIPNAELIWYDSVTKDGQLIWQNELNEHNRPFFDASDGIFTNYSWSVHDIESSALAAGSRLRDVYVGIDVWGRNFYGGGMFNTQEAVKVVYKYGCSLAIFAPAWTHEAMGEEDDDKNPQAVIMGEDLERQERFLFRDEALWTSLWPYLKTRLPCTLPFKTSFCLGLGTKRRMYGEVLCNSPWFNLRHMQYQPNSRLGAHGYLLSTKEKLTRASRVAIRDVKGILKFRESFMQFHTLEQEMEREKKLRIQDDSTDDVSELKEGKEIKKETHITFESKQNDEKQNEEGQGKEDKDQKSSVTVESKQNDEKQNEEGQGKEDKDKFLSQKSSVTAIEESKVTKMKNVFRRIFGLKKKHGTSSENISGAGNAIEHPDSGTEETKKINSREGKESDNLLLKDHTDPSKEESKESNSLGRKDSDRASLRPERSISIFKIGPSGRSMTHAPVTFNLAYDKRHLTLAYVHEEKRCLRVWYGDSFNGGTCLCVSGSDQITEDHRTIRLFHCDFVVEDSLVVCMVVKTMPGFTRQKLDMWLYVLAESGKEQRLRLVGQHRELDARDCVDNAHKRLYPIEHASAVFRDLQTYLLIHEPGFYVPIGNSYGWHIFYYQVPLGRARVTSINLRTRDAYGSILLGHVGLCARNTR